MQIDCIRRLSCPTCFNRGLSYEIFKQNDDSIIVDGVLWCPQCQSWYAIEDELLELLPRDLAYHHDRDRFWNRYETHLQRLDLCPWTTETDTTSAYQLQRIQQEHFDWYADNEIQSYSKYEQTPFWQAADRITFEAWIKQIQPNTWLLEVGCAQGRATFNFTDLPITILAFDISKRLVRQAIERYRSAKPIAKMSFFVADGHNFPIVNTSFQYVLIYGVLHHLPDPAHACSEVARVLEPSGVYFGSENNKTIFRGIFDLLQKLIPLWHEE